MKFKVVFVIILFVFLSWNLGNAQEEKEMYSMAVSAVRSKDFNTAFMHFRSLLENYPESKYRENALFALGEYYFMAADYSDAAGAFISLINDYPNSKGRQFALVYLLKIAQIRGEESLVKALEEKIVTFRQLTLLFSNFKEYRYRSPLRRQHKVIYYIDKVEFYVDKELFAKISY